MAGLEVQVGANIKDFQNKIKEVENDVQQLANEKAIQIKLGLDTKEITSQIRDAKRHLNDLKQTVKDTGTSFGGMAPKVANGGNALMQFSRIAQDAPFGIMGIGNNITATVEAFGHLRQSTGSAGGALKAVASSMLGSGGILLAVSLVTSGLTYMSQNGLTVGDVFRKMTGDFDKVRRSMQELNVETAKNAQAQISSVGAYVSAAKNINLSMSDRLLAVKKLQDEYPAYFGNLTKEQILNGNVATAVRGVTMALIAKAKAASLTDRIVKLSEEEEKIQNRINNEILTTAKSYKLSKKEAFEFAKYLNQQLRGQIDLFAEADKAGGSVNFANKAKQAALVALKTIPIYESLGEELQSNTAQQDKYTASLEKSIAASIKLETVKEKASKKANVTPQVQGIDVAITQTGLDGLISLSGMVTQIAKNVQGAEGVIKTSMGRIPGYFDTSTQEALLTLQKFNEDASALIRGSLSNTFQELGTSIGEALAMGKNVLGSVGKTLLNGMGQFLKDMGGLLIKYGTLAIAKGTLDVAMKTPVVGIAAGAAAIAVGIALSAAGGAMSARASQGTTGVGSTGASYNSPASQTSYGGFSGGSGSGTVVFEISGTSLIGVLSNSLDRNSRLGGNLGLNTNG